MSAEIKSILMPRQNVWCIGNPHRWSNLPRCQQSKFLHGRKGFLSANEKKARFINRTSPPRSSITIGSATACSTIVLPSGQAIGSQRRALWWREGEKEQMRGQRSCSSDTCPSSCGCTGWLSWFQIFGRYYSVLGCSRPLRPCFQLLYQRRCFASLCALCVMWISMFWVQKDAGAKDNIVDAVLALGTAYQNIGWLRQARVMPVRNTKRSWRSGLTLDLIASEARAESPCGLMFRWDVTGMPYTSGNSWRLHLSNLPLIYKRWKAASSIETKPTRDWGTVFFLATQLFVSFSPIEIRPHRFGGEGVLIGVQNGHTKCSSHIC